MARATRSTKVMHGLVRNRLELPRCHGDTIQRYASHSNDAMPVFLFVSKYYTGGRYAARIACEAPATPHQFPIIRARLVTYTQL